MAVDAKPRAKQGLLAADHSKRGRRFVTILDESDQKVTLLAPWEHAILVLCDGTRTVDKIADLLRDGIEDEPVTVDGVARCLQFFSREGLLDNGGYNFTSPGPRTMANIQQAYREWHKDPEKSGRLLSGLLNPPFVDDPPPFMPSPEPTVAQGQSERAPVGIGSTLVVDGPAGEGRALRSVLDNGAAAPMSAPVDEADLTNVADLLAAVDVELQDATEGLAPLSPVVGFDATDHDGKDRGAQPDRGVGRAVGGIADLPGDDPLINGAALANIRGAPAETERVAAGSPLGHAEFDEPWSQGDTLAGDLSQSAVESELQRRFRHRQLSEAALTPTLVGQAPPDGDGPPVIVSPARSAPPPLPARSGSGPRSAGSRVMATVGPEPEHPNGEPGPGARDEASGSFEDTSPADLRRPATTPPE